MTLFAPNPLRAVIEGRLSARHLRDLAAVVSQYRLNCESEEGQGFSWTENDYRTSFARWKTLFRAANPPEIAQEWRLHVEANRGAE